MKITRRRALGGLSAAAVSPLLKGCPQPDPGDGPAVEPATIADRIDTVVVVMMENRSFDHYFGSYSLLEGRTDIDGLAAGMANARSDGTLEEPRLATLSCVADPPHGWGSSHDQWAEGQNSGFVLEHEARHGPAEAGRVMDYWTREKLSCFYGLADNFALCERWFSSVMGPTWPNRYYSMLNTSEGRKANDPIPDELPTIFEQTWRSGRTYGDFYGNVPFAMVCARHSIEEPEMHPLEEFFTAAEAGELPNLCWIDPLYGRNDDHPPSHPVAGQVFVQSIYEALARSPQWERSLFVVTYDEHGGFFDHVPPPTTEDAFAADGFHQLGFRVPGLIAGPWVKEGYVCRTVLDHTSIQATLAALWDLDPLSVRGAAANHFLDAIDLERIDSGVAREAVELPQIVASDDELYAPECLAELPLSAGGGRSITGQPELEIMARVRFPGDARIRLAQTDEVYAELLRAAERLGVLRRA